LPYYIILNHGRINGTVKGIFSLQKSLEKYLETYVRIGLKIINDSGRVQVK